MRLYACDIMIAGKHISVNANMSRELKITAMEPGDWDQVKAIYLQGIATGNATFETVAPSWEQWSASHLPFARLVARQNDEVTGWAALSAVSQRCVYGGVAEVSVYVSATSRGTGLGRKLLLALIDEAERNGIWTLQAGMFPENAASLALHRSCGFREVGWRERIGKMNGVWRDTILLERRSPLVGID
jgi:L-amino acid N-acyltransferase YncA